MDGFYFRLELIYTFWPVDNWRALFSQLEAIQPMGTYICLNAWKQRVENMVLRNHTRPLWLHSLGKEKWQWAGGRAKIGGNGCIWHNCIPFVSTYLPSVCVNTSECTRRSVCMEVRRQSTGVTASLWVLGLELWPTGSRERAFAP